MNRSRGWPPASSARGSSGCAPRSASRRSIRSGSRRSRTRRSVHLHALARPDCPCSLAHVHEGVVTMASRSKDGEIIARWLRRNGYIADTRFDGQGRCGRARRDGRAPALRARGRADDRRPQGAAAGRPARNPPARARDRRMDPAFHRVGFAAGISEVLGPLPRARSPSRAASSDTESPSRCRRRERRRDTPRASPGPWTRSRVEADRAMRVSAPPPWEPNPGGRRGTMIRHGGSLLIPHNPAGVFPAVSLLQSTRSRSLAARASSSSAASTATKPTGRTMPESFEAQGELVWAHLRTILSSRRDGRRRPGLAPDVASRARSTTSPTCACA